MTLKRPARRKSFVARARWLERAEAGEESQAIVVLHGGGEHGRRQAIGVEHGCGLWSCGDEEAKQGKRPSLAGCLVRRGRALGSIVLGKRIRSKDQHGLEFWQFPIEMEARRIA